MEERSLETLERSDGCRLVEPACSTASQRLESLRSRLVGKLTIWLGSNADAEDAAQEALLAAWLQGEDFRLAHSPEAWLLRCARNSAIDTWRRETRRRSREAAWSLCFARIEEEQRPSLSPEALRQAISRLPAEASDLLLRVHFAGESVIQIAQGEGRSRNAVDVRLYRARLALSRILEGAGPVRRISRKPAREKVVRGKLPLDGKNRLSVAS